MADVTQPVVCPKDPTWLRRMLEILPPGLRGKLEVFEACPLVKGENNSDELIRPVLRN